jgi:hypothetical protein
MEGKCKGTETQRNVSNKGDLQITTAPKIHINTNKHARKETMHDDNCSDQMRNCNQGVKVKPATYDGVNSWIDYKSHFNMVAKVNNWSLEQKGLYLACNASMNCSFARVSRTSLGAVGYAKFESLLNTCPNSGIDSEAFYLRSRIINRILIW